MIITRPPWAQIQASAGLCRRSLSPRHEKTVLVTLSFGFSEERTTLNRR